MVLADILQSTFVAWVFLTQFRQCWGNLRKDPESVIDGKRPLDT